MSARSFVVAATRAGYVVTCIDAFADKQTIELAETAIVVDYGQSGFDADGLLSAIARLDASQYLGFIYGSGFEAQPELLQKIAAFIPLIGNSAETVAAIKATNGFFAVLDKCNIAYPKVHEILPDGVDSTVYLRKLVGGCGGTHISFANVNSATQLSQHYYQQWVDGRSVSLLFVANTHGVEVIGFNEQWLNPAKNLPFRYGGAVNNISLSQAIQQQLIKAAECLTMAFGLIGLNSLDAVVSDGMAYMLEINPRLSATFDLYDDANLMDRHLQACLDGKLLQYHHLQSADAMDGRSKAHAILYAKEDVKIAATFEWPNWVMDVPQLAKQQKEINILAGEPICTVSSQADLADQAQQLAYIRLENMQKLLQLND